MRQFRVCDSIDAYEFDKALDKAFDELAKVDAMSEAEACEFRNTDTKEEALQYIQDEINYIELQLDRMAV